MRIVKELAVAGFVLYLSSGAPSLFLRFKEIAGINPNRHHGMLLPAASISISGSKRHPFLPS
jgi:hypothetical protein